VIIGAEQRVQSSVPAQSQVARSATASVRSHGGDGGRGESGSPIKVLLCAEMGLLRHALESVLSDHADIEVVAAVADHATVPQVAQRVRPDVVVLDVDQPDERVPVTVHRLWARIPQLPVVALVTARPTTLLRDLLETGAVAAVDKNAPTARLVEAVRSAAVGVLVVEATVAAAAVTATPNPLTLRERDVLKHAATGATGTEIATRLRLSPGTVRNYLSNAITKTGGRSRIDAVRIAYDAGWLLDPPN
jgi:two-component system response regulator DesR